MTREDHGVGFYNRILGKNRLKYDCFLNAVLQALVHTPQLARAINDHKCGEAAQCDGRVYCATYAAQGLIQRAKNNDEAFHPDAIRRRLYPLIGFNEESPVCQDASEMWTLMVGKLQKEANIGQQLFSVYIRSEITCENCGFVSETNDVTPLFELPLVFPPEHFRGTSVAHLLQANLTTETISYRCSRCCLPEPKKNEDGEKEQQDLPEPKKKNGGGEEPEDLPEVEESTDEDASNMGEGELGKDDDDELSDSGEAEERKQHFVDAQKKTFFRSASQLLVITVKRFTSGRKINSPVIPNLTLTLPTDKEEQKSRLRGMIEHVGTSMQNGHYKAYMPGFNGRWYEFDDERIEEIDEEALLDKQPYWLIYAKSDDTGEDKCQVGTSAHNRLRGTRSISSYLHASPSAGVVGHTRHSSPVALTRVFARPSRSRTPVKAQGQSPRDLSPQVVLIKGSATTLGYDYNRLSARSKQVDKSWHPVFRAYVQDVKGTRKSFPDLAKNRELYNKALGIKGAEKGYGYYALFATPFLPHTGEVVLANTGLSLIYLGKGRRNRLGKHIAAAALAEDGIIKGVQFVDYYISRIKRLGGAVLGVAISVPCAKASAFAEAIGLLNNAPRLAGAALTADHYPLLTNIANEHDRLLSKLMVLNIEQSIDDIKEREDYLAAIGIIDVLEPLHEDSSSDMVRVQWPLLRSAYTPIPIDVPSVPTICDDYYALRPTLTQAEEDEVAAKRAQKEDDEQSYQVSDDEEDSPINSPTKKKAAKKGKEC